MVWKMVLTVTCQRQCLSHTIYLFPCLALLLRAVDIAEDTQDNPSNIFLLCFRYTTIASYLLFTILMNILLDSFVFSTLSLFLQDCLFKIVTELLEKINALFHSTPV